MVYHKMEDLQFNMSIDYRNIANVSSKQYFC